MVRLISFLSQEDLVFSHYDHSPRRFPINRFGLVYFESHFERLDLRQKKKLDINESIMV